MVQVTAVSDTATTPKVSGGIAGGQAGTGEFDLAMAALCALLSSAPVGVAQGQSDAGCETAKSTGAGSLSMVDPAVFPGSSKEAMPGKAPEGGDTAGEGAENGVQNLLEAPVPIVLQQNPAMIMAPVQNATTPDNPLPGTGKPAQQTACAGGQAVPGQFSMIAGNAPVNASVQQAASSGGQAVFGQSRESTGNTAGNAPVFGAAPVEVQKGQPLPGGETIPGPSQQGVQLSSEASVLGQEQLSLANQEPVATNLTKETLTVNAAGEIKQAEVSGQAGFLKAGSFGKVSPPGKPEKNKALQENKPAGVASVNESTLPGAGKNGLVTVRVEAIKTGNADDLTVIGEKAKPIGNLQGSTAQPTANMNSAQSNLVQPDLSSQAQPAGDVSKGVGLPDLKERLVQEIKHVLTTYKGEPQTQVQLKLEPEHLGQLTIKLYFNKGELSAHFYTGNSYVKDVLEGSIQQLRDALGQQDLRLSEALVFTGNDGRGGTGHYFGGQSGRMPSAFGGYNSRTYGEAQVEPLDYSAPEIKLSQVNYLI